MLVRKGEVVMNTCGFENLMVLVKSINNILDCCESHFIKVRLSNQVAEVQNGTETFEHLGQHIFCNCGKINLVEI